MNAAEFRDHVLMHNKEQALAAALDTEGDDDEEVIEAQDALLATWYDFLKSSQPVLYRFLETGSESDFIAYMATQPRDR